MEEKVSLPIKTKIAAWWMIIMITIGIIMGIIGLWFKIELVMFYILSVLPISIFLLPCILLFRRKKLGWYWGVITLSGIIIVAATISSFILFIDLTGGLGEVPASRLIAAMLFYPSLFLLIIFFPPLILLLLDRKNFWKIAN